MPGPGGGGVLFEASLPPGVGGRGGRRRRPGASPVGAAVGADLGGSSKYSSENLEGRSGEGLHVNSS